MKQGLSLQELAAEIDRRSKSKRDLVVSTKDLEMTVGGELIVANRERFGVNNTAHNQIAAHTEIPARYYAKMREEAPDLLASNVNRWFRKYPLPRMVRSLDGHMRALLSDRYRPLENEDLAQAVLPVLLEMDVEIMSSAITETKLYIKAVDKRVARELAKVDAKFGDGKHKIVGCIAPAITISNSEVGMGALSVLGGVYDSFCSNLATFGERSTRKYHVGQKHEIVGDDAYHLLSDETRRKTDEATWHQIKDVVRAAFDRAKFESLAQKIEGTQKDKIDGDPVKVVQLASSRFGLNEATNTSILRHLIEGGDLSRFGLYNAVTRAAQDVDDYDQASDMERYGAQVIELQPGEWKQLAQAA